MSKRNTNRKYGNNMVALPPQGKQLKIQSWLMSEGWQIGEAKSDQAVWAITATNPVGQVVVVLQPKQAPDLTVIQARMEFDAEFQSRLASLSSKIRQDLFWDIRFSLLNQNIDFEGMTEPPSDHRISASSL